MKNKSTILILFWIFSLILPIDTPAAGFDQYYEYGNPDGTFTYYFADNIFVTVDKNWYENTIVVTGNSGAGFYHKTTYNAFQDLGMNNLGLLFNVQAFTDEDFKIFPNYEYLGYDEAKKTHYIVYLPSDYPPFDTYIKDQSVRAGYDALWAEHKNIIDKIRLKVMEEKKSLLPDNKNVEVNISSNVSSPLLTFSSIEASSTLIEEGYDNNAYRVFDDDIRTAWQEGVPGNGECEALYLSVSGGPYQIESGTIYTGYLKNDETFQMNGAPITIELSTDKSGSVLLYLADIGQNYNEAFSGFHFTLNNPMIIEKSAVVRIIDVRPGTKFDDSCISEISLFGSPYDSTIVP